MSEFEMWVYRGLITTLFFVVVALIKTIWNQRKEKEKAIDTKDTVLSVSVGKLETAVNELRLLIVNINARCPERHIAINGRMKMQEKQISDLEKQMGENCKDIAGLKTLCHE